MKTIRISANNVDQAQVREMIDDLPLDDTVEVVGAEDAVRTDSPQIYLEIVSGEVVSHPDWYNQSLPFVFPPMTLTKGNLLGLIFHHLGLMEDAMNVSLGETLHYFLQGIYGQSDGDWLEKMASGYYLYHNQAVLSFFNGEQSSRTGQFFRQALGRTQAPELQAYTLKYFKTFLHQSGTYADHASEVAASFPIDGSISQSASKALDIEDLKVLLEYHQANEQSLSPQDKKVLWQTYEFYQQKGARFIEADLLLDMAAVSLLDKNFAESIGYIQKAVAVYEEEGVDELLSQAYIAKGNTLHQWAKSGAPQFYQAAIESYQKAIAYFRKEDAPYWFAEIHHRLAVLYAEMPEEQQKRAIWAAVSATSFKEALGFFTKEHFPLEYAAVCHNYATALINYPSAVKSDNIERSMHLFKESLEVRDAASMPQERAMTLLNYVEACWEANNLNAIVEKARLKDMVDRCEEVLALSDDSYMTSRAEQHLASIAELEQGLANNA